MEYVLVVIINKILNNKKTNMDLGIHVFPSTFTLIGINYEKMNMMVDKDVKVCHQISIGILILILEISIYEKGSV